MKILGLDYGEKRVGLAVCDEMESISFPLTTIKYNSLEELFEGLKVIIEEKNIQRIVVGLPKNMAGGLGKQADKVMSFVELLHKKFSLKIDTWDERMSTKASERILLDHDVTRKKRKNKIDKLAAQFILQGYLDYKKI